MDDLDLSGVDPLRRTEVRRRIAVIKSYLAIPMPTQSDRIRHAAELDRSVNQFMALVRAWRDHKSGASVAGAGVHRRAPRRPSRLSVSPEAKRAAAKTIEEAAHGTSLTAITKSVNERCKAMGLSPPSRSTLWNMMSSSRSKSGGGGTGVVIGTCKVRIPVTSNGTTTLPDLTLAVRAHNGTVLAAALVHADWRPALTDIVRSLERDEIIQVDRGLIDAQAMPGIKTVPGGEGTVGAFSRTRIRNRRGPADLPGEQDNLAGTAPHHQRRSPLVALRPPRRAHPGDHGPQSVTRRDPAGLGRSR